MLGEITGETVLWSRCAASLEHERYPFMWNLACSITPTTDSTDSRWAVGWAPEPRRVARRRRVFRL